MTDCYFIVNPVSGSGRAKAQFDEVRAELCRRGMPCRFDYTAGRDHARQLAAAALLRGETRIISVGGDGTANEVASALINTDAAMGILPFGTGNDFARALGLPTEAIAALDAVLCSSIRKVDAATAKDKVFINVAGTGFDVDVILYTEKFKRRLNGMLPYMLGIFQSLIHLRTLRFSITADGEHFDEEALLFDACNGSRFAGGINVAPLASVQDGMLDVCILRRLSIPGFLMLLPRFVKGQHIDSKHIRYLKAREITVESSTECTLNLDGELGSSTPVTFRILPGALNMLLPEKG